MEGGNDQWTSSAGADAELLSEQEFDSTLGLKICVAAEMADAAGRGREWFRQGGFDGSCGVLMLFLVVQFPLGRRINAFQILSKGSPCLQNNSWVKFKAK